MVSIVPAVLAAAFGAAPAPALAPDTASLRFAWPEGLTAEVHHERTRALPGSAETALDLRGRLVTERKGGEMRVAYREWRVTEGVLAGRLDPVLKASEEIATVSSLDGDLVRVEGIERAMESLRTTIEGSVAGGPPEAKAAMKRLLEMGPALMTKEAAESWSVLVAFWKGSDLEVGEEYEAEGEAPVQVLPGEKVRIALRFGVGRRLRCPTGGRECVELRMRSEPEAEDVARVLSRLMKELGVPAGQADALLAELSVVTEVTLVTEPDRLVPHRMERVRRMKVKPRPGAGADARGGEGRDRSVWSFSYATPKER